MNHKRLFLLLIAQSLLLATPSVAQHKASLSSHRQLPTFETMASNITMRYIDSLVAARNRVDSLSQSMQVIGQSSLVNPYYYRLFVSPMLYRSALKQTMDIPPLKTEDLVVPQNDAQLLVNKRLNDFFLSMYTKHPNMVQITDSALEKGGRILTNIDKQIDYKTTVSEKVRAKEVEQVVEPIVAVSRRPNFWSYSGRAKLQLMQNYYSDNWYQGGTNYNSMFLDSYLEANYNNKQRFHWDNKLEVKLGWQTNKDDAKHKFKTNTDLIRLTNSVGLQAKGNWFYSASLKSWTQGFRKYNNNSDYVYCDFMSPFESILSFGMEYKKNTKKSNIKLQLAPVSYDFIYVGRKNLTSRYGVNGNHHTKEKIGSSIMCDFSWRILNEITWSTHLLCYTNYHGTLVQWENTLSFTINKYLTSNLYIYPRFDDTYRSSKSNARIQFKEQLTLGLDVRF